MAIAERSTITTWEGSLEKGAGKLGSGSSGALDGQEVTWAARTEAPEGKTSPEELLAAAHSSCFSMALALMLGQNKTPPTRLDISATVVFEEVDGKPTITTSNIHVRGQVEGLDAAGFDAVVSDAAALCPVSRLFASAQINVETEFVS